MKMPKATPVYRQLDHQSLKYFNIITDETRTTEIVERYSEVDVT